MHSILLFTFLFLLAWHFLHRAEWKHLEWSTVRFPETAPSSVFAKVSRQQCCRTGWNHRWPIQQHKLSFWKSPPSCTKTVQRCLPRFTHQQITISCWIHLWCTCSEHDSYLIPDGYFNPEVVKYRQLCAKSQKKQQLHSLQQYYHKLLKHILVSRKVFL